jgi:hypothetical protein
MIAMGETPFQNPANDEDRERPGETPGERAQRLYQEQSGLRQAGGDAGPAGRIRQPGPDLPFDPDLPDDPELGSADAQPGPSDEPEAP